MKGLSEESSGAEIGELFPGFWRGGAELGEKGLRHVKALGKEAIALI